MVNGPYDEFMQRAKGAMSRRLAWKEERELWKFQDEATILIYELWWFFGKIREEKRRRFGKL